MLTRNRKVFCLLQVASKDVQTDQKLLPNFELFHKNPSLFALKGARTGSTKDLKPSSVSKSLMEMDKLG